MGYTLITFPDDPFRRDHRHALLNPPVEPRSMNTVLPPVSVVLPMMCAATRLGLRAGLEDGQRLGAVRGGELGAQILVVHLAAVQFRLQALVFLAHVQQHEIIAEEMEVAAAPGFDARAPAA